MATLSASIAGLKLSCLLSNCLLAKGFRVAGLMCSLPSRNIGPTLPDKFHYIEDKASYEDELCDVNTNIIQLIDNFLKVRFGKVKYFL